MPQVISDVDRVLTTTRSVRRKLDLDRPVSRETIAECLELAQQATMASNQEDWRFVAVADEAQKARLAEVYREAWRATVVAPLQAREAATGERLDPAARATRRDRARQERVLGSVEFLVDNLERVPVLVVVCSAKPVPETPLGGKASAYYGSIMPIAWSFQLALRSRGLGSVMATAIAYYADDVASILALPKGTHPITMIPVAYTTTLEFKRASRRPLHEILQWDRWAAE